MAKESSVISNGTTNGIPKGHVSRKQTPVAILGYGCRLPGQCNSPRALWDFLARGSIAKHEPPPNDPCRFNLATHYDGSTKPGTMASPGGMFLEEVDLAAFDASFFNLSRTDATSMDPQQRLLLEVAYECLENCGITLEQIRGTNAGCIVAVNSGEYEGTLYRDPEDLAPGRTTGFNRSILSNRISHFLDIHGPSITVDTACSGTMTAIDLACQYLQLRGADSMIVAGANLYIDPVTLQDSGPMKEAFSRSGRCHAFDAKADGYIRAEAINTVLLKRLDDAVRDGDPIRAVICGTAATSDGHTPGLTSPNPAAQAAAIRTAYRNAGITCFDDTGYLECHGTGTYSGDPLEVEGLASVFASTRPLHKPLVIGSIKSNIGHSEAAAGLSGIIKAAMVVEKGVIPGNPTFVTPNPGIDFERSRVRVARDTTLWPDYAPVRRASVNSFGFGGANGHCVLEAFDSRLNGHGEPAKFVSSFGDGGMASWMDHDDDDSGFGASKPLQLLLFSANDRGTLAENVKAISNHLIHPAVAVSLADVAYTLSERRTHHFHRAFLVTDSADFVAGTETVAKKRAQPPRVGFVFTGQGAQWSAMGKELVNRFPLARTVVANLDAALQSLPEPPSWSLLDDLTQKRDPSYLRRPEISQPLVTALQLALLRILNDWGICPEGGVIGHSSGEIAAAVAAGLITEETAIKVAYFRGQAALQWPPQQALGMLAVGLSLEQVQDYLTEPMVHIACFNSPTSLTISGPVANLEQVRDRVQKDGHFARMLQVDLAYHSEYMEDIATRYESLLVETCANTGQGCSDQGTVPMISSVTGLVIKPGVITGPAYWRSNMTNPVRFAQAASELLTRQEGPEFLVEIGPSNALAGPVGQIIAALGSNFQIQYTSAAKRGADTLLSLFDVAGRLWANGGHVNMTKVNAYNNPSLVVDLPNYRWNHSNRYWHQGFASEEWRHRKFISHDLLGSKVPGIGWQAPCWLRVIRLQDLPWLKHHEHAGQFLFPASGFLAMAMEAVYQTTTVNEWSAYGKTQPAAFNYHLEDVQFLRGLELSETSGVRVITTLTPVHAPLKPWHQFKIMSVGNDGSTSVNCIGLARISERDCLPSPPPGTMGPLKYPYKAEHCYKMMHSSGWKYGPHFQRLVEVQWTWGESYTLGSLSMAEPPSTYQQSRYPIHPVSLDSLLQIAAFSVFQRQQNFSTVEVLVPARIGSLVIPSGRSHSSISRVVVSAELAGQGKKETATSYQVSGAAYDPEDEHCVLEVKGLNFNSIEARTDTATNHSYARLEWDIDLSLTDEPCLSRSLPTPAVGSVSVGQILKLVHYTNPATTVLEVATDPESISCLGLEASDSGALQLARFHFVSNGPKQLLDIQDRHSEVPNATFELLNVVAPNVVLATDHFDFAILRIGPQMTSADVGIAIDNISRSLHEHGQLLLVNEADPPSPGLESIISLLREKFANVKDLSEAARGLFVLAESPILDKIVTDEKASPEVDLVCVRFSNNDAILPLLDYLRNSGLDIRIHDSDSDEEFTARSTVICLDELFDAVTARLTATHWDTMQSIVRAECRLLWVTSGAQMDVTEPDRAASQGLFRVIRSEEPHLRIVTLDVEKSSAPASWSAIHVLLDALLHSGNPSFTMQNEFAERGGAIYTPRVMPDEAINEAKFDHIKGRKTEPVDFSATARHIQWRPERTGGHASLQYAEIATDTNELAGEDVEVELHAVGVNFNDVVLTRGLVDESLLGSEGAGVVTRVCPGVTSVRPGQRVVVIWKGLYSNRVRVPARWVHAIPDTMSFEQAATLPMAYVTVLRGLRDLAGLKRGQSVLIHSATGGVGNAAIQLSQHIGAEIFATAGTPEKRRFLEDLGIPSDHIFSSRDGDFEKLILQKTNGHGIDVILNSLSGHLLEASWNIVAYGGTFIELGKRDMYHPSRLSMEPFNRAASFRTVDLTITRVDYDMIARLLHELFELLNGGHIKPLFPVQTFAFDKLPDAMQVLQSGRHIGKLVISREASTSLTVPVRHLLRKVKYREEVCYLIVGGLKGLGSCLAVELARSGAKHIAALSRSGYNDEASKATIYRLRSLGAHVDLLKGDITKIKDVREAFKQAAAPIGGIIQGAMVLRDHPFSIMTIDEFHAALDCKINGTWNLHKVALEQNLHLDFFTLLSSISSILGSKAQANYAAGNSFLDAFSSYRHGLGLPANTVNLGVIQDVGYIARNDELLSRYAANVTPYIGEDVLSRILQFSILQQTSEPINPASMAQMITGLACPQPADSNLRDDARLSHLFSASMDREHFQNGGASSSGSNQGIEQEVRELKLMIHSANTPQAVVLEKTIAVVSAYLVKMLRLADNMEPERPLSAYGIDSLAAVDFRNWIRRDLRAVLSTMDVTAARSLRSLCQNIIVKIQST